MTVDDMLAAAGASIASMPDAELTQHLNTLEAAYRRRGGLAGARHRAEVDSIGLDWAAYQLACQHDDAGDLPQAAHWYRMAAANDFADSAYRLGTALEMLAAQRAASAKPGSHMSEREELTLVSESARWYAEAYAAGHPEAADRLDGMISRHDARRPRSADPVPAPGSGPERCDQGGLDTIINSDLITATTHFRRCTACQREFLDLGGLLPTPNTRATRQLATAPGETDAESRQTLVGELAR